MELDKQPLGSAANGDRCLFPEPQPVHGRRISSAQFSVIETRNDPTGLGGPQFRHQGTLNNQGKNGRFPAALEVVAPAMWGAVIEGQSAFVAAQGGQIELIRVRYDTGKKMPAAQFCSEAGLEIGAGFENP